MLPTYAAFSRRLDVHVLAGEYSGYGPATKSATPRNVEADAEALYDGEADAYLRPVTVDVHVSRAQGSLRIVDNCRGMAPDVLSRVVMRVENVGRLILNEPLLPTTAPLLKTLKSRSR